MQIHELGELFEVVQTSNILGDGKTFPDCIARKPLTEIQAEYEKLKGTSHFNLKKFILDNFSLPESFAADFKSNANKTPAEHIQLLWDVLTRQPKSTGGSLISLPHPYVVPGGRFREIYYWDSYFTMLGLRVSRRFDLIENMIDNFAFLIDKFGYVPNGNRTYFIGRSQPPFFSLMVKLLAAEKGSFILKKYLPQLEKEWSYWTRMPGGVGPSKPSNNRVVFLNPRHFTILNRYWDENDSPRPESYKEDVELAHSSREQSEILFRHLRAAAESGWDFSSRWFRNPRSFATIHTTDIVPVDLNCLLWHLEVTLAEAWRKPDDKHMRHKRKVFLSLAEFRKAAIMKYCWNKDKKFFFDYDFVAGKQTKALTLAAVFPLFFNIATRPQAVAVAAMLKKKFLKRGGLITTTVDSGQQWDAPNGWAPLQWIAYKGLLNYGLNDLASKLRAAWIDANTKVYKATGKMTEKYNVTDKSGKGGGGEYPNQDGFGWTNGVFLAMTSQNDTI
ncbi:MAG TPA: alpha,alpha-trehalase TreF [Cyclobacteriaceae bacterium]|nr:alpha,alpha-trehalase TreF [Cyclobacteriaceae bacterium]